MSVSTVTSDKIKIIGLALTLVVVLHHAHNLQFASDTPAAPLRYAEYFFHYGLRALAVPFFFICSGFFLADRAEFLRAWPGEVRKRFWSLLVPFLVWSGGWLLALWCLERVPALAGSFGREHISLANSLQVLDFMTLDPIPHPLWYMRDLFLLAIASPAIIWLLRQRWGMFTYFAIAVTVYYSVPAIEMRESGDLLFFGIGAALAIHKPTVPMVSTPMTAGLCIMSFGLILYHGWWVDTYHAESQWILNTAALIGLPAIWSAYDRVAPWVRTTATLAAADFALFIYMGHEPLVTLVRKLAVGSLGTSTAALTVIWLGSAFGVTIVLVLTAMLLRRWLPPVYAVLSGGRGVAPRRTSTIQQPQVVTVRREPRTALPINSCSADTGTLG